MSRTRLSTPDLIGLLYRAAADPEQWDEFLRAAGAVAGCDKAVLSVHESGNRGRRIGYRVGLPEEAVEQYNCYYGALNPVLPVIFEQTARLGGWCGLARAINPVSEYRRTEYYAGWGRPWGAFSAINATVPRSDGDGLVALSLMRGEERPELGQDELRRIAPLLPHLERALHIHATMASLRLTHAAAQMGLAAVGRELAALDARGHVLEMTPGVEGLLRTGEVLQLVEGRLRAVDASAQLRLEDLVRLAVATGAGSGEHAGGSLVLERSGEPWLRLRVLPFRSDTRLLDVYPCALVLIEPLERNAQQRLAAVASRFGLTPAETRLAASLARTCDLQLSAAELRLTRETSRFMLKTIFRKTSTGSQLELLKLLLSEPPE